MKENKLRKFSLNSTQLFNLILSPSSAFSHSWRNKSRAESVPHVNSIDKLIVICAINFRTPLKFFHTHAVCYSIARFRKSTMRKIVNIIISGSRQTGSEVMINKFVVSGPDSPLITVQKWPIIIAKIVTVNTRRQTCFPQSNIVAIIALQNRRKKNKISLPKSRIQVCAARECFWRSTMLS
jgi:hypothetical protein